MLLKIALALGTLGLTGLWATQDAAAPLQSGRFNVDPAHSTVVFKIQHLGVSNFYGRFDNVSGKAVLDGESPDESMFTVTIAADSVDTNSPDRDNHLKSPDFFDTKQFPEIRFGSTKIVASGKKGDLDVTGTLEFRGVEKEMTVHFTHVGHADSGRMGYRAGYEARFTLKRSDFGNGFMVGPLGDEVEVVVSMELVKA